MNLCDIETIRAVLGRHGFHFSKSLGQNFLTDITVPERIAEMSGAREAGNVVEVGPGMGCLSAELCRRADKVVAVELDRALMPVLAETLADYDNFEVVHGDVLETDLAALCKEKFGDGKAIACANLPYYITSPILMRLLEEKLPIRNITVMVQKEAAQRLCAAPGTREAGAISYAVAYYAKPKLLFTVQPGSFYPAPKCDQRGHPAGCPHHTACYPAQRGRSRAVPPDPGSIFSAAQDRGQCRGERPGHFQS